jgi:hypothetical protein
VDNILSCLAHQTHLRKWKKKSKITPKPHLQLSRVTKITISPESSGFCYRRQLQKKTPGLSFTFLLMTILISLNSEKIPEHQNRPINRPTDPEIHEKCKINDDFVSVKAL